MATAGKGARTAVIIAARLEAAEIDGCMRSLVNSETDRPIDVHIVCNGPSDDTPRRAEGWAPAFERRGWTLTVHETDLVGKPAALRYGATFERGGGVVVLDARVRIHPTTLEKMISATEGTRLQITSAQLRYVPVGG